MCHEPRDDPVVSIHVNCSLSLPLKRFDLPQKNVWRFPIAHRFELHTIIRSERHESFRITLIFQYTQHAYIPISRTCILPSLLHAASHCCPRGSDTRNPNASIKSSYAHWQRDVQPSHLACLRVKQTFCLRACVNSIVFTVVKCRKAIDEIRTYWTVLKLTRSL